MEPKFIRLIAIATACLIGVILYGFHTSDALVRLTVLRLAISILSGVAPAAVVAAALFAWGKRPALVLLVLACAAATFPAQIVREFWTIPRTLYPVINVVDQLTSVSLLVILIILLLAHFKGRLDHFRILTIILLIISSVGNSLQMLLEDDSWYPTFLLWLNLANLLNLVAASVCLAFYSAPRDASPPDASRTIRLTCPRCTNAISIHPGIDHCPACRLQINITLNEGRCPQCRYALRGLISDRCPECGTPIVRNNPFDKNELLRWATANDPNRPK